MARRGVAENKKDKEILIVLLESFVLQKNLGVVATHKIFGARFTVPKTVNFSNDVNERIAGRISDPLTPSNVPCPTEQKIVVSQLPNSPPVSLAEGQMFGAPHSSPEGSVIPGREDLQIKRLIEDGGIPPSRNLRSSEYATYRACFIVAVNALT
jgi:hypothetical protein